MTFCGCIRIFILFLDSPATIPPSVFQTPAKFTKLTPTTPLGPKPILFSPNEVRKLLLYIGMVLDAGCAKSFITVEFKNPWAFKKPFKTQNCQQRADDECLTVLILKQYHAIFEQEHVCLCNNRLLSFSRNKQLGSKSPLNTVLINLRKHFEPTCSGDISEVKIRQIH